MCVCVLYSLLSSQIDVNERVEVKGRNQWAELEQEEEEEEAFEETDSEEVTDQETDSDDL